MCCRVRNFPITSLNTAKTELLSVLFYTNSIDRDVFMNGGSPALPELRLQR